MKIYIAAPLFSEGERQFNEQIDAVIRSCGHETFLPQREGGCVVDLPDEIERMPKRKYLFRLDCEHMDWCDAVFSCSMAACRTRARALSLAIATQKANAV